MSVVTTEVIDFYNNDEEFHDYVDKYSKQYSLNPMDALFHAVIKEAYVYYKNVKKS